MGCEGEANRVRLSIFGISAVASRQRRRPLHHLAYMSYLFSEGLGIIQSLVEAEMYSQQMGVKEMPRTRNDCAALSPKQFRFRNKLRSFSRHSGFASHVIYPRYLTKLRNNGLSRYYCPMIIFLLFNVFILITTSPTLADSGAYRLRAGDTIAISISGASEMRQTFVLDLDGQISVPLVGVIKAEGSTIGEFRDKLQQILPRRYCRKYGRLFAGVYKRGRCKAWRTAVST